MMNDQLELIRCCSCWVRVDTRAHPASVHLRKRHSFLEFSLCLSRACLGKKFVFIYKWLKKWRVSHPVSVSPPPLTSLEAPSAASSSSSPLALPLPRPDEETPLFLEFSLCVSRACLGKIIVFVYEWLKKTVFSPARRRREPYQRVYQAPARGGGGSSGSARPIRPA